MDQINTQPVPTTQLVPPAKSGLLRWILVAGIVVVSIGGVVVYLFLTRWPGGCTLDARSCPDGSVVGRRGYKCEFAPCSGTASTKKQLCTEEAKVCPDGSTVARKAPNCEFEKCPIVTSTQRGCSKDGKVCLDGSVVERAGANCEFTPCPSNNSDLDMTNKCKLTTFVPSGFEIDLNPNPNTDFFGSSCAVYRGSDYKNGYEGFAGTLIAVRQVKIKQNDPVVEEIANMKWQFAITPSYGGNIAVYTFTNSKGESYSVVGVTRTENREDTFPRSDMRLIIENNSKSFN